MSRNKRKGATVEGSRHSLRIIAGQWRGRRFDFPAVEGLRPTGDRIRETLFNWLQMAVSGSTVLDLFAGSGALGLEAASRGAARVLLNDASPRVTRHLQTVVTQLGAKERVSVRSGSALDLLRDTQLQADIVFVDPPFAGGLFEDTLQLLAQGRGLANDARIYLETPKDYRLPEHFTTDFEVLKEKTGGQVDYRLLQRR